MKGFSIIEIIVTLAIFSTLVGLGLFMGVQTISTAVHRSEEATIVSLLQKARSRAMNNLQQSAWGVCYKAPNYVIFKGRPSTCAAAVPVDTIAANANVATVSDFSKFPIIFTQLSGTTTAATLSVVQGSDTKLITVNYEGTIIW